MLLSESPEVLKKLREEHSRVFNPNFNETVNILQTSPQKLDDLEYTATVIKEVLRLFPVGFSVRQAEDEYAFLQPSRPACSNFLYSATITYKGKQYPLGPGLVVVNTPHTPQYDPKVYPKPAEFIPERFMDSENMPPRNAFRTFGRGARACMGQNLATNELKVILLMRLREYDFETADRKPNKEPRTTYTKLDTIYGDLVFQELGMEAKPRGGMKMRVRKRE